MALIDHDFNIYYNKASDPLNSFYIPALSTSVKYDRSAGFFSSTALAVAAEGVARLIENHGHIRLLVGADLSEEDVKAIISGHQLASIVENNLLAHFNDPIDALHQKRLEVLAYMIAENMLEIKVVVPKDDHGNPIPASLCADYYHPKSGVFTDQDGDQVAFQGSVNESATAWLNNYEEFCVYRSWGEGKSFIPPIVKRFEKLWNGDDEDWIALAVPQAVTQKLLKYRPDNTPTRDPFEVKEDETWENSEQEENEAMMLKEEIIFQYLRDAPRLLEARGIGSATAPVTPYPHQVKVADKVISEFPSRVLLCDEVGLGKTIETGLIIRQLLLSGQVERCLILTPKSVLKQWQEELFEKFNLNIPRFLGNKFLGVYDQPLYETVAENPWDTYSVFLAGSQLAKRTDRRNQLLGTKKWDLLVVDEAHHARRKDFKERIYRPNRLLGLLNEMDEHKLVGGLVLMTATPMQVHPLEIWDLLSLLGMGGKWGSDEDNFLDFFNELRRPFSQTDWNTVFEMVSDYISSGGEIDGGFRTQATADLGPVKWSKLEFLTRPNTNFQNIVNELGERLTPYIRQLAQKHTPLKNFVQRNTRSLLREYVKKGILKDKIPTRHPEILRVEMTAEEFNLYDRIDEYIHDFYQKYEEERRGLGFIMTVYRRRLTSSFYAIQRSLERRYKYLKGELTLDKTLDDDDIEQEVLDIDIDEQISPPMNRSKFQEELVYVKDFISNLRSFGSSDSKIQDLKQRLAGVFNTRNTVIIFTQYTDTMDYIKNQLVDVYGSQVGSYSGRGGEIWNGIAWINTTKDYVKKQFKEGQIRILVCTDSASEGLNLQTCGVLINYDMPWNPMRVEQRIGRIDRIGQKYDDVWIKNYFYKDTIEDIIYQRLSDRINWFENVVGDLQPILAEVGEVTRRLAMASSSDRGIALQTEINELKERLQNREFETLDLDDYAISLEIPKTKHSPVNLSELQETFLQSHLFQHKFTPHPAIPEAYNLEIDGKIFTVTFSKHCFDENPESVGLLSYGSNLLEQLLTSITTPEAVPSGSLVRISSDNCPTIIYDWYGYDGENLRPVKVKNLAILKRILNSQNNITLTSEQIETIRKNFEVDVTKLQKRIVRNSSERISAVNKRNIIRGRRLLLKAAIIEIALGQQSELYDQESYPIAFSENAVTGLQRHGFPWGALLTQVYDRSVVPTADDPYLSHIIDYSRQKLKETFKSLENDAKDLVEKIAKNSIDNDQSQLDCKVHTSIKTYLPKL